MNFPDPGTLYPMLFDSIYQRRLWGGNLMHETLHRDVPSAAPGENPVGEAWELVDRDDAQSSVANGALAGVTLRELVQHYGSSLIGNSYKGGVFPILVKLIDAGERLSLQVHPDENYCRKMKDGSEPKTEMWYIVSATSRGEILAGLSPRATRQQLVESLNSPAVANLMQVYPSQRGDSYFITSGTLHAIGEGNLILEIQQNSDTTFRVSDWGRIGPDGKPRKLHVEQGMNAIDFTTRVSSRIPGVVGSVAFNRRQPLVDRHCFKIENLLLVQEYPENTHGISGSCHILSVGKGSCRISAANCDTIELATGRSALIPASLGAYTITPLEQGTEVLKTSIN